MFINLQARRKFTFEFGFEVGLAFLASNIGAQLCGIFHVSHNHYCLAVALAARKGGAGFFVVVFAVNNNGVLCFPDLLRFFPHPLHKRTGGVVSFCFDAFAIQQLEQRQGRAESRDHHHIFFCERFKWDQLRAMRVLQKANTPFCQVFIHLRIVDHFAEQENTLVRIFGQGPESDLNCIFHAITKAEMAGNVVFHRSEIQYGRTVVLFTGVLHLAVLLYL